MTAVCAGMVPQTESIDEGGGWGEEDEGEDEEEKEKARRVARRALRERTHLTRTSSQARLLVYVRRGWWPDSPFLLWVET